MGNKPETSVGEGTKRTLRPRQFSDAMTTPVPILTDDDPRHGTINGRVNFKCKCPPCYAAGCAYWAGRRAKGKGDAA